MRILYEGIGRRLIPDELRTIDQATIHADIVMANRGGPFSALQAASAIAGNDRQKEHCHEPNSDPGATRAKSE